jgi:hypothetical protein
MAKITVQVGTTEPIDTTIRPASYMRASRTGHLRAIQG